MSRSPLQYALYLLGRRSRSVREMREKLRGKDYTDEQITQTISVLEKGNLLNDAEFARNYAQDKVKIYRRGRHRIALELIHKGVGKELIDEVIKQINNQDELDGAVSLLQSRERSWQALTTRQRFERAVSLLQRRGFSGSVIREAVQITQK